MCSVQLTVQAAVRLPDLTYKLQTHLFLESSLPVFTWLNACPVPQLLAYMLLRHLQDWSAEPVGHVDSLDPVDDEEEEGERWV